MHTFAPKYAETTTIMTRYLTFLAVILMTFVGGLQAQEIPAADAMKTAPTDTLFIYMPNGRLDVYPPSVVEKYETSEVQVLVTTLDGKLHAYPCQNVDSVSTHAPADKPFFITLNDR